jgi:spore maturation protein CgeB
MVAGDWHSTIHEEAIANALVSLGHATIRFPWHGYFAPDVRARLPAARQMFARLQNKVIAGPLVARLNADFVARALAENPDALFVYRGTHISAGSLRVIKSQCPRMVLVGYNNDDPFSKDSSRLLWRHFLSTIPIYDLLLAYRLQNLEDFRKAGARRVELLRSWFVEGTHRPIQLSAEDRERYGCDVVFVGHYEPDNRVEMLEAIAKEGFSLKLFGPDWDSVLLKSSWLRHLHPVQPARGELYSKAITGAKISLCFLSKLNRDTYTRRVFEITALRSLLMSEFTEDLATLFEEDREAVFFRSKE